MPFRSPDDDKIRFAAKAALRERLKRIRRALPRASAMARDAKVHTHCLTIIETDRSAVVGSYLPMQSEISTEALHDQLRSHGLAIAVPAIEPEHSDRLTWRKLEEDTELIRHPFGFDMPTRDAAAVDPESIAWVLLPCLAVDQRGFRLGWGGGFYDRAVTELPNAIRIAIAYDFQLMAELPTTTGDQPVDWIVTDAGKNRASRET